MKIDSRKLTTRMRLVTTILVAMCAAGARAQICSETVPPPTPLGSPSGCNQCLNSLLPGTLDPHPVTRYYIESDLPEKLLSTGVLYASVPVLPPDSAGNPALEMRTQVDAGGFTTIDDDVDVFFWHTSSPGDGSQPRRIVIYVRNNGTGAVQVTPKQAIVSDGGINTMGATLATRVLTENWDTPIAPLNLSAGVGEVVAYSKRFSASSNTSDTSANVNCFGRVRVDVANADPAGHPTDLAVYVVAIGNASVSQNKTLTEALLGVGATSGDPFDLNVPPSACANRRATGVMDSFVWRNDDVTIDAADLIGDGIRYRMAMADLNTQTCPAGRQTAYLLRRPGFVRPDSVGNYMKDYRVTLRLVNTDSVAPRAVDLKFTNGFSIGLGWRVLVSTTTPTDAQVDAAPVRTGWAGANQTTVERSLLESDGGPVILAPCQERYLSLHMLVLGNSSLPFDLRVAPVSAGGDVVVDNRDANCVFTGTWPTSSNSGYWGLDSQYHAGDGGASRVTWTPDLPFAGTYNVYAWWIVSSNRATAAPFTIVHSSGSNAVTMNQTNVATAGKWNLLGTYDFSAGTTGFVRLSANVPAAQLVSADAVKFEYVPGSPGPGDVDGDGDVDLADYASWDSCMNGPGIGPVVAECAPLDLNGDDDIDLADFAAFTRAFTGS
jgi:hypothetical protein